MKSNTYLKKRIEMNKNVVAVVAAALINNVVGAFWYSEYLFGPSWAQLRNVSLNIEMKTETLVYGALLSVLIACLLAYIIKTMKLDVQKATRITFLGLTTFMLPYGLQGGIYAGLPVQLLIINLGYNFVSYILMAAVIAHVYKMKSK